MSIPYHQRCIPEQKIHYYPSHIRVCYCGQSEVPDRDNKALYGPNEFLFAENMRRKAAAAAKVRGRTELDVSTDEVAPDKDPSYLEEWGVAKDKDLLKSIGLRGEELDREIKSGEEVEDDDEQAEEGEENQCGSCGGCDDVEELHGGEDEF